MYAIRRIEIIDRGGFGRVEKVILDDNSIVARKTFDPNPLLITAPDVDISKLRKRFLREMRVQAQLPPEFFVPVLDCDEGGENPWYTMPLADENYTAEVQRNRALGTVSPGPLADIMNALEELHRLGFVHRDLKPANVLRHDGVWKLSDMGLVLPKMGQTTRLSSVGSTWGTQLYCAPEQVTDFSAVTATADIYSFGCILHDLFGSTPRIPYTQARCEGAMGLVVEKCTETDPARRFKNVTALRGVLLGILSEGSDTATTPEAAKWVSLLAGSTVWDSVQIEAFARFVCRDIESSDRREVFRALDEDTLRALHEGDEGYWSRIAEQYCAWVRETVFAFDYCDVVASRLRCVFELGPPTAKAQAALAAAELGESHNRWFVMRVVLRMCDGDMPDDLARRLAIEIQAEEMQPQFRRCAEVLDQSFSVYHPRIAEVIST